MHLQFYNFFLWSQFLKRKLLFGSSFKYYIQKYMWACTDMFVTLKIDSYYKAWSLSLMTCPNTCAWL